MCLWHCHLLRMRKPLLLLALLLAIPMKAEVPEIQCPGQHTIEMRWCASQLWEESHQALQEQLSMKTLEKWKAATQDVCADAYILYREGTIYPQMVVGCEDRLNRALLKELQGLGR